jgi:hypothetical protein
MCTLGGTFVPFYTMLSKQFITGTAGSTIKKSARFAAMFGIVTGLMLSLAAAFPQDLFPQLHLRLAQLAFVVLAPALFIYWWLVKGDAGFPRPCAPALLVFLIIIIAGITITIASGQGCNVVTVTIQATTQKIMVYSWNCCLFIEAWGLWKRIGLKKRIGNS